MSYLDQLKSNFVKKNKEEILLEQEDNSDVHSKLILFFSENPTPTDDQVHDLAKSLNISPDDLESHIYSILGSFLGAGKSKEFKGEYDPVQLKMGIKVEMEHTTDPLLAERIAKDHLAEITDYYTRLSKMEKEAGISD